MLTSEVAEMVVREKIMAIIRGVARANIIDTVRALRRGGIHLVEVTLDQSRAGTNGEELDSIQMIAREFPAEVIPGAGTVLTPAQASLAIEAGARYIVSPDVNPHVIRETRKLGALSIPGAFTPTEIASAVSAGADFVKLFPAGQLGCEYVKAIRAPLSHVRLLAVGGVDLGNMKDFLRAGVVGFGIGGSLVDKKIVARGDFDEIEARSRAFVSVIRAWVAAAD